MKDINGIELNNGDTIVKEFAGKPIECRLMGYDTFTGKEFRIWPNSITDDIGRGCGMSILGTEKELKGWILVAPYPIPREGEPVNIKKLIENQEGLSAELKYYYKYKHDNSWNHGNTKNRSLEALWWFVIILAAATVLHLLTKK